MTAPLLGVPGSPEGEPGRGMRALATVEYSDDVHGSYVGIEFDDVEQPDQVLAAAIRYRPDVHGPEKRHEVVTELMATIERGGFRQVGPIVWGEDDARVRVEFGGL